LKNDTFRFKQFSVKQDRCAMKIGTDAVLLATLPRFRPVRRILDIGTGTGVVALMLAQQMPAAHIDAIELDPGAARQAAFNFSQSPWAANLHGIQGDFLDFSAEEKYDLIVSNPPYFTNALRSDTPERNLARHADESLLSGWLLKAAALLNESGNLALILPYASDGSFIAQIPPESGLFLHAHIGIHSFPGSEPVRMIVILSKCLSQTDKKSFVIYEERNKYSASYVDFMKDYFIIF
jgi:tRNA1Val (adenine37-N6)-methyltransferase